MSSNSEDPLNEKPASDMLAAAMAPTQPISDSSGWQPPSPEFLHAMLPGYHVEEFLARGGMGAVYRGMQVSLSRRVAIKVLPPKLAEADANFAERFKQEARAMAQLNHPGIVSVYDFGEMRDGTLYFIMEFVDGTDVSHMVAQQGRLPSAHAMVITAHVCDALQYAHERGVVHRDIKPANIIVGYDGSVKVADFGLAKSSLHADTSLTVSGHVMGTPHFVAPEALTLGSSVDHRADIYAVGVMLYQMLTGKLPQGLFEMPSMQVPGLDPRYDAIVAAAMREDREQRYQHIHDMRRALDSIVTQPVGKTEATKVEPASQRASDRPCQQQPRAAGHPQRKGAAKAPRQETSSTGWAALFIILLALSGGAFWLFRSPPTGGETQSEVVASPTRPPASTPSTATKEQPFVNSLGMKFVPVPGTKVLMCIHPTRVKDFQSFASEHRTGNADWQQSKYNGLEYPASPDHAVTMVNWFDAKGFCDWLSKKEGLNYRLPSNDDWRAAAAGTLRSPPPSDELYAYRAKPRPPVMKCKPNSLGIHDLGLMGPEWCSDDHPKWKDLKLQNQFIVERAGAKGVTDLIVTLPPNGSDEMDADGPDERRPDAVIRCVVDLEALPSRSTSMQADPYANPAPGPAAPLTQEDYSVLAVLTIYGVAREEAAGYLRQARLKSDPAYFVERLTDSAIAGFASVVSNLAVSSRFGGDSKVKSQYSIEFSITSKSSGPILNLDLSSLHAPSGSRLTAVERPVKRGETIYLGSFDEETADPMRPVRIAFLTFR